MLSPITAVNGKPLRRNREMARRVGRSAAYVVARKFARFKVTGDPRPIEMPISDAATTTRNKRWL